EEEEKLRKIKEEEEEKERIRKELERAEEEEEAAKKRRAASLSAIQAKMDSKKHEAKSVETTGAEQVGSTSSAVLITPATPSVRPAIGSLRPGGLRPSRGSSPAPTSATPSITMGLRPGGGNRLATADTITAMPVTPAPGSKRLVYN
ncbi:MAG: hypothetical protein ACK53Y_04075, partial [bacterium]